MVERATSTKNLPAVSNGHGGARANAGGGPRRVEVRSLKNEVLYLRAKYKKMPLNHLLEILNNKPPPRIQDEDAQPYLARRKAHQARQDWAAQTAAPFMHHRLSAIEISGPDGGPIHQKVDITKLTGEELDALEKLVRKASIVTLDEDQYHEVE